MYNMNTINTAVMLYMNVVHRVNPKSSHHQEEIFFYLFNFASI